MVNYADFAQNNNFTIGSSIEYNGSPALIKWATPWSNTITIECNGETITVDKNDLFGMNNKINEQNDYYTKQIEKNNELIAKNDEKVEYLKELWQNSVKTIKDLKEQIYALLKDNNVSDFSKLNKKDQSAYLQFMADINDAKSLKHFASNGIIRTSHSSVDAALDNGDIYNQQLINNAYLS